MKLISFTKDDRNSYGLLKGDSIIDLGARLGDKYPDLKSLLAGGLEAAKAFEASEASGIGTLVNGVREQVL